MLAVSQDHVVEDSNAEQLADLAQALGELDVLARGRRIAAGVIVRQNDRCRRQEHGRTENFTRLCCRSIYVAQHRILHEEKCPRASRRNITRVHHALFIRWSSLRKAINPTWRCQDGAVLVSAISQVPRALAFISRSTSA